MMKNHKFLLNKYLSAAGFRKPVYKIAFTGLYKVDISELIV